MRLGVVVLESAMDNVQHTARCSGMSRVSTTYDNDRLLTCGLRRFSLNVRDDKIYVTGGLKVW